MVKLIRFDDPNVTDKELELYQHVEDVAGRLGVSPSVPVESETFFINLLQQFDGKAEDLTVWLEKQIVHHFIALGDRPKWIQGPEWPFANGVPMLFAGQIDVQKQQGELTSGLFHDDTSLYVFVGKKVPPVVVVQQY